MLEEKFWLTKSLADMNHEEWEAVCDGCALCCLQKLQDDENGEVHYTDIACRYLDQDSCSCSDYQNRATVVPTCINLNSENLSQFGWLPSTCAYRLLAEGKDLYYWHPLVSGRPESVHEASISVRYKVISEDRVPADEHEDHIVHWVS